VAVGCFGGYVRESCGAGLEGSGGGEVEFLGEKNDGIEVGEGFCDGFRR